MIVMSLMTMHRMVSARGAGHNVVAQPSLLHFAQLFQFALLSHAHQIDNDPDVPREARVTTMRAQDRL